MARSRHHGEPAGSGPVAAHRLYIQAAPPARTIQLLEEVRTGH